MSTLTHDPYLNTAKRSLEDKKYKERYEKKRKNRINKFLTKKVSITDYINLSEGVANTLFLISFLIVPYVVGVSFIFFIIAQANIKAFNKMNINEYSVYWSIGYEVIASILLIFIVKSAISFKKS